MLEGHGQTILTEIKDAYFNLYFPLIFKYKYTKEEVFTFKDGGQTKICYKMDTDTNNSKDWLFLFSGQGGTDQSLYIKNIMKEAYEKRGYNVCMISWRGQSGVPLKTPQLYNAFSVDDVREPMQYVHEKYIKGRGDNVKVFAIGCSMGAMVLANALGVD